MAKQKERESQKSQDVDERRHAPRWPAPHVPWFRSVKLISGPEVNLLNVSRGGALLEGEIYLSPESTIALRLDTTDATLLIKGRVLRSIVADESSEKTLYHSGVAFDQQLHIMDAAQIKTLFESSLAEAAASVAASGEEPRSEDSGEQQEPAEVLTLKTTVNRSATYLCKIFGVNHW